jgi:hypothetical protein
MYSLAFIFVSSENFPVTEMAGEGCKSSRCARVAKGCLRKLPVFSPDSALLALSLALLGFTRDLLSLFPAAVLGHCAGDGKTLEKQVATIAQKIVDAKHSEQNWRRLIAPPNA